MTIWEFIGAILIAMLLIIAGSIALAKTMSDDQDKITKVEIEIALLKNEIDDLRKKIDEE